jgi:hypothetical protein
MEKTVRGYNNSSSFTKNDMKPHSSTCRSETEAAVALWYHNISVSSLMHDLLLDS